MSDVLHVVEPARLGWAGNALLRAEVRPTAPDGPRSRVVMVGAFPSGFGEQDARDPGDSAVPSVLGGAVLAWAGLRSVVRRTRDARRVHAWSAGALAASRLAFPRARIDATFCFPPTSSWEQTKAAWIIRRTGVGGLRFLSTSVRDAWAACLGGLALEAGVLTPKQIAAIPAPVDPAHGAGSRRATWGVDAAEKVLIPLADAAGLVDARRFAYHLGVMSIAGHRVTGVVPSGSAHLERAVRFTRRHESSHGRAGHGGWRLLIDDAPLPSLLASADVAVRASEHACWSESLAEQIGVPVARTQTPTTASAGDRVVGLRELAGVL